MNGRSRRLRRCTSIRVSRHAMRLPRSNWPKPARAPRKRSLRARPDCSPPSAASLPRRNPVVHRPAARDHGRLQQARPACNFAQTAAQAALRAARELESPEEIATVSIRVPDAAARYPGCDSKGPFPKCAAGQDGIPFSVAAVLARSALEEDNYAKSTIRRSCASSNGPICKAPLIPPPRSRPSRAPRSSLAAQWKTIHQRLDNVIAATPDEIRRAFDRRLPCVIGDRARDLEELVDNCTSLPDSRVIAARCRLEPTEQRCGQHHDR